MSLFSPELTTRDPFELDRLAEELIDREEDGDVRNIGPPLPEYVPLAHDNPYLLDDAFNVENFLLSRSKSSLPDLRAELKEYLVVLKKELVQLINDDYEAFISLSTDLRGEGVRLNNIKFPLASLKAEILESKHEFSVIQDAIQNKLEQRAVLREETAILHLLLKISDSVTRLESLLLISSPEHSDIAMSADDMTRANKAKHLSRVASEFTQLLYHISKAQSEKCAFVDEIQWRVDRIQSTLSSDLDSVFSQTVLALTEGKVPDIEKTKWMADLNECLRIYDLLGLWDDAEDVLRREVIRSFVKKTIYSGALQAPPSPLLPHTPFRSSTMPVSSTLLAPRTPYTPYTALLGKQIPYDFSRAESPYAHILDESDDPLAKLYNQVLRFVERDLSRVMEVAEKVTPSRSKERRFDIMANVVWDEFGRAIMEELGNVVFAVGRPIEFRKNYQLTEAFIRSLEFLAPSASAVQNMRSHPTYVSFERRWQLPVYFQLRWKEIIGALEDELSSTRIEPLSHIDNGGQSFHTSQASAVHIAIAACWSQEVFLPALSPRFWRLTLQLLSRYKNWLDQSLALPISPPKSSTVNSLSNERRSGSPSPTPRATTPNTAFELSSMDAPAIDDAALRQYVAVIMDVRVMNESVTKMWRSEISMMIPNLVDSPQAEEDAHPTDALKHRLDALTALSGPLLNQIVAILTKRCCDALTPVKSIPSQFRAMSNKKLPTDPSYFIPTIFRPVTTFFGIRTGDGIGAALKDAFLGIIANEIFENVCQKYVHYITLMKKTEESLRRFQKKKKSTFSLFGNASAKQDEEARDEERIRRQMILDVDAFSKEAQELGVNPSENVTFKSLDEIVRTEDADT